MGERSEPDAILSSVIGSADVDAPDVFTTLGSQTRLAILFTLWAAFEPFTEAEQYALPYSELRDRVGIKQGGEFNYHLEQLMDRLVVKTEDGYAIHPSGLRLVQMVITGVYRDEQYPETELARDCVFCGGTVVLTSYDGYLIQRCTECEGRTNRDLAPVPPGTIAMTNFPPSGLGDRSAEELAAAGLYRQRKFARLKMGGVCPYCAGRVESTVEYCGAHAPSDDGFCEQCDSRFEIQVSTVCQQCKSHWRGTSIPYAMQHPAAIAWYYDRGLDVGPGVNDFEGQRRILELDRQQRLMSTDPMRVEVTLSFKGDELTLVLDESLTVIETHETD